MATYDPFAHRPYIGPGVTTVVGDPNNPWGGQVQPGQQNTYNPNETPEQAIVRLNRIGVPLDQIAQLTGVPPDQIAQVLSQPTPAPQPATRPPAIGIESVTPDSDLSDMNQLVDQGQTVTDVLTQGQITPPAPENYLTELGVNEMLSTLIPEAEDEDALDAENNLAQKVETASTAGAAALGEDDPDALQTLQATMGINSLFGGSSAGSGGMFSNTDPNALRAKLDVYKDAAEIFFNTDELAELVPRPDQALPYMVAGAALIQSGEEGESWGSALSKALSNYSVSRHQEGRLYEQRLLDLEMQERAQVQKMAADLYIADRNAQLSLANSLLTTGASLYEVEGRDGPVALNTYQLQMANSPDSGVNVLGPWTESTGRIENYTVTDDNGISRVIGITGSRASELEREGRYANIQKGDQLSDAKMYLLDGTPTMLTPSDAAQRQQAGESIRIVPSEEIIEAYDPTSGRNVFVLSSDLLADSQAGVSRGLTPINDNMTVSFDQNGNPVVGSENFSLGIHGAAGTRKILEDYGTLWGGTINNADTVLSLIDTVRDVEAAADAAGAPIFRGPAGVLTQGARQIIDFGDQVGQIFSAADNNWRFYQSNQADGTFNASTDQVFSTPDEFRAQFNLDRGMTDFFVESGLSRVESQNLLFQLALADAMLRGQKGRDISDKDIERFLRTSGAAATSKEEFRRVLNNLEDQVVQYGDRTLGNGIRNSVARMTDPDDPTKTVKTLEYYYGPQLEEREGWTVTGSSNQETTAQRRARLADRRRQGLMSAAPPTVDLTDIPTADQLIGVGQLTQGQVLQALQQLSPEEQMGYLATIRSGLGDSDQGIDGRNTDEYRSLVAFLRANGFFGQAP